MNDGYIDHPDAKKDCRICNGGGLLDDGDGFGAIIVPCPCTGKSYPDIVRKVTLSLSGMKREEIEQNLRDFPAKCLDEEMIQFRQYTIQQQS